MPLRAKLKWADRGVGVSAGSGATKQGRERLCSTLSDGCNNSFYIGYAMYCERAEWVLTSLTTSRR